MVKSKEYTMEDFISKSEKVLEELGDLEGLAGEVPTEEAERIQGEIRRQTIESIEEAMDLQINGYAELSISEDEMTVTADFYPPTGQMKPIELDDLSELLSAKEISSGVDWEAIKEAIFKCNTEGVQVADVVIARGTNPVAEVPEHLVVEERLLEDTHRPDTEQLRVDFKAISPFVLVKEGDVLARRVAAQEGKLGSTVLGKAIAYYAAKVATAKPGENTREEGQQVVAACDGRFMYRRNVFWVNPVLEISSDIDYHTGHIDFPGDVIIRGEIKDGFKVYSGGSVYCRQTMDASEVICQNDIVVNHGIIGKQKGTVKVGGGAEAKFIENCYLEAKGQVYVEVGILNSAVHTRGRVEMGNKGIIIGGKIYAQDGVTAKQIGSSLGPRTEIYCGIDYSVEQKLEWIREKNIELTFKLKQIERRIQTAPSGKEKLLQIQEKLKEAIHKMNGVAGTLIFQLDKNEEADVVVKGNIFPGTYIEICHLSYVVAREMRTVRFRLDKSKGKIVAEPLDVRELR